MQKQPRSTTVFQVMSDCTELAVREAKSSNFVEKGMREKKNWS